MSQQRSLASAVNALFKPLKFQSGPVGARITSEDAAISDSADLLTTSGAETPLQLAQAALVSSDVAPGLQQAAGGVGSGLPDGSMLLADAGGGVVGVGATASTGLPWAWYVAGAAGIGAIAARLNEPKDTTAPSLNITDNASATTTGNLTYTFAFSEAVSGFTADDVTVSGGTKGAFTQVSGSEYTLVVNPTPNATGALAVSVAAGAATDAAGNASVAAVAYDTQAPTITVVDNAPGTALGDVTYRFTFSEPVSGFTAADIVVSNGSKGAFTPVSGSEYTLVVSPTPNTVGTLTVGVAAGSAFDAAGNGNAVAGPFTQAFDTVPPDTTSPGLSITDNQSGTASGVVTYSFNFSESVSGFTAADVTVTGGSKGALTQLSGSSYTLPVTPDPNTTGSLAVSVAAGMAADAAGNTNTAASAAAQAYNTVSGYIPGQAEIDLGVYGKLLHPVKVDGDKWYYVWDMNGDGVHNSTADASGQWNYDGTVSNAAGYGYQKDYATHDVLDGLFNQNAAGAVGGGGNTDDTYRYATLNGVRVALPTATYPNGINAYQPGTAVDNSPAGEINVTYDDLLAVWDGHNGTGTGTGMGGTPSGWQANYYWSATPSASGHAFVNLDYGYVYDDYDWDDFYVALQVL